MDDEDSPTEVQDWVSTGSTVLDAIISNRRGGGAPVGKIMELHGPSGSGKSLLASHIIANTQQKGGIGVYIDTENAIDPDFLQVIGVKPHEGFILVQEHRVEQVFNIIERIIDKVREKDSDKTVTIVLDSIAAMTTEKESEEDYDKEGFATDKAIVLSKSMRKITDIVGREKVLLVLTNQIRDNVGSMFGPDYVTPGGHAVGFHSSVRIHMRETKDQYERINGVNRQVGATLKPKVRKNRLGPPGRSCEFDLFFSSGIDDVGSIYTTLKDYKCINGKGGGGWYKIRDAEDPDNWLQKQDKNEPLKVNGKTGFRKKFKSDERYRQNAIKLLYDNLILDYEEDWVEGRQIFDEDELAALEAEESE
jgi:recombination protein RecA